MTYFHTQDGTTYVTLESGAGTSLAECRAVMIIDQGGPGVSVSNSSGTSTPGGGGGGGYFISNAVDGMDSILEKYW